MYLYAVKNVIKHCVIYATFITPTDAIISSVLIDTSNVIVCRIIVGSIQYSLLELENRKRKLKLI